MSKLTWFSYLIPLGIFVLICLFLWRGLSINPRLLPSTFINKSVPTFSMQSLDKPNHQITNKEFLGHVSLLNVWATWCYSCRAEHSVLIDIADSRIVKLYGIVYKDKRKTALQYLHKQGNPYVSNIFDGKGQLAINLGVYGTPETFLIDQKGVIRYKYVGPISPEVWHDDLLPRIKQLKQSS